MFKSLFVFHTFLIASYPVLYNEDKYYHIMKINIINNTSSQGFLIGEKLVEMGNDISYYLTNPDSIYHGNVKANIINIGKKWGIPYERTLRSKYHSLFTYADLEISNIMPKYARANDRLTIFHGSELRDDPNLIKRSKITNTMFASTPDLLKYDDRLYLFKRIVDFNELSKVQSCNCKYKMEKKEDKVIIGHFPTIPSIKGSKKIVDMVDQIQREDDRIVFYSNMGAKIPKTHFVCAVASLDIFIDQFTPNIGAVGISSLQAIALGVPSVCTINQQGVENTELFNYVSNFIIKGSKLHIDIDEILQRPMNKAIDYVRKHHNTEQAIKLLKDHELI